MTSSPALGDDLGHLVHLSLRTAESSESLLCELACALVLAVTEEFDDAALVWGEAVGRKMLVSWSLGAVHIEKSWTAARISDVPRDLLHNITDKSSALAEMSLHARHTRLWGAWCDFL